ncbi:MAG TPA: branched-chain amino acid ABC transporter permease [Ktedonobacteraceae bacterium]|jgi:branched-chain amino acid transport system permease protein|nr:branched-chain amino acid ABC transporter permease [Ktedonobacteraceae bacterium]
MATGADTQASPIAEAPSPAPKESRGWLWSLLIGLLILGLISTVPLLGDASALHTWTLIVMFIVLAQSWNFIGGFAGYAAFGNVAFFGIGAYTTGLMLLAHHPFWSGLVLGALVAGLFAFLLGLPVLRLKGHYFAIATLGIAEALGEFTTVRNIGGGGGGLMSLPLPGLDSYVYFFYAFMGLAVICLLVTVWLTRSRFGYALVAIRESERAAEALGIATYRYKVIAFVMSALPTAIAGGLYAYWSTGFDPSTVFDVGISVEMVLLCFLGGAGTILGPIVGAVAFELASFQLQTSGLNLHNTLLGLAIAIVTIFLPQGVIRVAQEFVSRPGAGSGRANSFMEGMRRVRRFIAANGI